MASCMTLLPWHRRLFDSPLIQCGDDFNPVNSDLIFDISSGDTAVDIVGIFFLPANVLISDLGGKYSLKLVELYERLNGEGEDNRKEGKQKLKKFEVIQILPVTTNLDVVCDEETFNASVKGVPWFAVPFSDIRTRERLSCRYKAKTSVPTLILLECHTGNIITSIGWEKLEEDPEGSFFPWRPRPISEVLWNGGFVCGGKRPSKEVHQSEIMGLVKAIYFSAHWCPPCKAFTPQLVETYTKLKNKGKDFEVIFVSSDRSLESYSLYLSTMPWLAIPYEQEKRRQELASLFGVQGIPSLIIVDSDNKVITADGREEINDDPDGENFPWQPQLVNILTERFAAKLHTSPSIILFVEGEDSELDFAESVLVPAALDYKSLDSRNYDTLQFFIGYDCETSDFLREILGIDDAVPLLTAIDIPSGKLSIMEDGAQITEESVKAFVARFLSGNLPSTDIMTSSYNMNTTNMSAI